MVRGLQLISRHGRVCLILGLIAGLALPDLAATMQPWLPHMVALLLVITALRIGHHAALGSISDLWQGVTVVLALQMALPLLVWGFSAALGQSGTPVVLAMILATAAPAITGSPNLALLLGMDGGQMMQILVLGTALFPATVLPLLLLSPEFGPPTIVLWAAIKLLTVIFGASAVGFGLRAWLYPRPTPTQVETLDGLSILAFSGIVIGLMAALNPTLRENPETVLGWMVLAFALSYGLQVATQLWLRRTRFRPHAGPFAIGAGNRNIALFLVALPAETIAPLMVFVGCWQVPMYLTPILMRRFYQSGDLA